MIPATFGAAPTLFITAHQRAALLVTPTRDGHRATRKRFQDPHRALEWCIAKNTNLVYTATPAPARN